MPSPNNVLTADSYIQDGLVFQLDGIEYGGIDGQWIERKSGDVFQALTAVAREQNCFVFTGSEIMQADRQPYPFTASYQLETVIAPIIGDRRTVFGLSSVRGLYMNARNWYPTSSNDVQYIFRDFAPRVTTIANQGSKWVSNGRSYSGFFVGGLGMGFAKPAIGKYSESATTPSFRGKLFAIRVYSRQLSDREILINQKIDNARFGLGLDIPDEVLPASRSLSLLEPFELPDESESEKEPTNDNSDER